MYGHSKKKKEKAHHHFQNSAYPEILQIYLMQHFLCQPQIRTTWARSCFYHDALLSIDNGPMAQLSYARLDTIFDMPRLKYILYKLCDIILKVTHVPISMQVQNMQL